MPTDLFYNTGISTYIWLLSKNKRPERKGKIQLIDASGISHKLRKPLGNKKNEFTPEDRAAITKLYADFQPTELCKIYDNEEFMYREYTVMQPLQRSYSITVESIDAMIAAGSLKSLYDEAAVLALEELGTAINPKDKKKLDTFKGNKFKYDAVIAALRAFVSDEKYLSPKAFTPVLEAALGATVTDSKLFAKIMDGLSVMDKEAEIQKDKKGNIIYDKETKDTEIVKYQESIETYMAREVLPHIPDAQWFWEEDSEKKNPVIKTGAEIPFTRYFYKYQQPTPSEELEKKLLALGQSVSERMAKLFQ